MTNGCFSDQEMMNDVLSTQKFITSGYNTTANEAASPNVKNVMMSILEDEHALGHEVFCEMQSRGWYQTEAAEQAKIDKAKNQFGQSAQNCCF